MSNVVSIRKTGVLAGLALIAAATPALAAKPPKPNTANSDLSIGANKPAVTYGSTVNLLGRAKAAGTGTRVDLQANPYPFAGFGPTGVFTVTSTGGEYLVFGAKPLAHTQYQVIARLSPPTISGIVTVFVRIRVSAKLSDATPAKGRYVWFSGSATPAHDGARVWIQKRSPTGRFITITRTILKDDGIGNSRYSKRLRVHSTGTYRVKVAGDIDHLGGISALRKIRVH